jgi:hypothetical protein
VQRKFPRKCEFLLPSPSGCAWIRRRLLDPREAQLHGPGHLFPLGPFFGPRSAVLISPS